MNTPGKLATSAFTLAVLFAAGLSLGSAVGPFEPEREAPPPMQDRHGSEEDQ